MTAFLPRDARMRVLTQLEAITHGRLALRTPEGDSYHFGSDGPEVAMTLRDWSLLPALALRGDIGLGEGYVAGLWDTDDLEGALQLFLRNMDVLAPLAAASRLQGMALRMTDRILRANSLTGAARNIRAHYDVGNEFYQLWLDRGMSYSSALFGPGDDLEQAQYRKNARILSKLSDGESILEIGCGWGGFAEAAADQGRFVTGLTLSPSQAGYAHARLDGRADIRLQDYRKTTGTFDNIVSVEMIEAVGERYWPRYFTAISERLAKSGRAVIQAITVPDQNFSVYREKSDYIRHHVFPGGMLPCESAMTHAARAAGLECVGRFAFGADYARTCRIWSQNLQEVHAKVLTLGFDEAAIRGWRYYLDSCAATFATGRTDVVQMEFAHAGAN